MKYHVVQKMNLNRYSVYISKMVSYPSPDIQGFEKGLVIIGLNKSLCFLPLY